MPRPIIITEEIKERALADFSSMLDTAKMPDGKLSYSKSFYYKAGSVTVWLSLEAYKKTVTLLAEFKDEVAWHGTVSRLSEDEFIIEDVLVYPQEVTGSTVNTDQEKYTKWLYDLEDDTFNAIRMQGHSHVNMGVSPSRVDDNHRQKILSQLESTMFYIFMIWNKSLAVHTLVYDMQRNILYENDDVKIRLVGEESLVGFLADAKEKVQKAAYKAPSTISRKKPTHKSKKQRGKKPTSEYDYDGVAGMYDHYDLGGPAWRL